MINQQPALYTGQKGRNTRRRHEFDRKACKSSLSNLALPLVVWFGKIEGARLSVLCGLDHCGQLLLTRCKFC